MKVAILNPSINMLPSLPADSLCSVFLSTVPYRCAVHHVRSFCRQASCCTLRDHHLNQKYCQTRSPHGPAILRASFACMQDEEMTPIKQDTKKGKLRFYPYNIKCAPCLRTASSVDVQPPDDLQPCSTNSIPNTSCQCPQWQTKVFG